MFNLFKGNKRYPAFETLKAFDKQYRYFIRTAQWDWVDRESIFVVDPHKPRMLTLDPWPQLVFLSADGQMSVTEYVLYTANAYKGVIPENLDETIINELNTLKQYGIIDFIEKKQRPESKHDRSTTEINKQNNSGRL